MKRKRLSTLVALNAVPGVGARSIAAVLKGKTEFNSLINGHPIFGSMGGRHLARLQLGAMRQCKASAITSECASWPIGLNQLFSPPPFLFVIGNQELLGGNQNRVCIIGARACTPYGRSQSARFASGLAQAGITVVSGGARGIDQAAMKAALDAGGKVIAIVGSGLDRPYPPEATSLYKDIVSKGGAVISEFAFGTNPHRGNFPRRNRLLAAISPVVLVVQAAHKSGTLSTVKHVEELGRTLCAIPGPVDCAVSQGPNALIADGAKLVQEPWEIIEEFNACTTLPPNIDQDPLLQLLDSGDKSIAQLSAGTGETIDCLQYKLSDLEIQGRVSRLPGGIYHRCH